MSSLLSSSSVSAGPSVATYSTTTKLVKNADADDALNIGNLDQESTVITLSDDGLAAASAATMTFSASGKGYSTLSAANVTGNVGLRFQLLDSSGNSIVDSWGTEEQQANFTSWIKGTLELDADLYTVVITPAEGSTGSGTLSLEATERQGTTLKVASELTGSNMTEYYNYSFVGDTMKLDFNATKNGNLARVIVRNGDGAVIADNQGNTLQRSNYIAMTSGTGLARSSDDYTVEVTYKKGVDATKHDISYNLQLYAGSSYAVIYKTTAKANPTDLTAAGSVTATLDAELLEHTSYHKLDETPYKAINIGWIQQDKSALDVFSQLTMANATQYYTFALQKGDNLKFGFKEAKNLNTTGFRVQLMNSTGTFAYADNEGSAEQRAAYEKLTTASGWAATAGQYIIKVTYAENAVHKDSAYEFGVYSGTSYSVQYKTISPAQTLANALRSGQTLGTSSRATGIAAYLKAWHNEEESLNNAISDALKKSV